jgi:hypothetical protein
MGKKLLKYLGFPLVMIWSFLLGYIIVFNAVGAMGWSGREITLVFREGGLTADMFLILLSLARGSFIVLTVFLLVYTAYFTTLSLKLKEALRKQEDRRVMGGC